MVLKYSLGIWQIGEWIIENWKMIIPIGLLILALSLSGNITRTIRAAKVGLKEAVTPLGFIILGILIYLIYQIYLKIAATL